MAAKKKAPKKLAKKAKAVKTKAVKAKAKPAAKAVKAKAKKTAVKKTLKSVKKVKAAKPKAQTTAAKSKVVKTNTAQAKNAKTKIAKTVKAKNAVQKTVQVAKVLAAQPKVQIDYSKAITPLLDRVVVKVLSGERVTAGGLIIPETASMATGYLKAKVLAIGSGLKTKKGSLKPLDVQVGDTVLFASYAGTKVVFNSEELEIIHESDVMGVVQD